MISTKNLSDKFTHKTNLYTHHFSILRLKSVTNYLLKIAADKLTFTRNFTKQTRVHNILFIMIFTFISIRKSICMGIVKQRTVTITPWKRLQENIYHYRLVLLSSKLFQKSFSSHCFKITGKERHRLG